MNYIDNKEWIVIIAVLSLLLNYFLTRWIIKSRLHEELKPIIPVVTNISFIVNSLYKESELVRHLAELKRPIQE